MRQSTLRFFILLTSVFQPFLVHGTLQVFKKIWFKMTICGIIVKHVLKGRNSKFGCTLTPRCGTQIWESLLALSSIARDTQYCNYSNVSHDKLTLK
jgi:hypothetical protein